MSGRRSADGLRTARAACQPFDGVPERVTCSCEPFCYESGVSDEASTRTLPNGGLIVLTLKNFWNVVSCTVHRRLVGGATVLALGVLTGCADDGAEPFDPAPDVASAAPSVSAQMLPGSGLSGGGSLSISTGRCARGCSSDRDTCRTLSPPSKQATCDTNYDACLLGC